MYTKQVDSFGDRQNLTVTAFLVTFETVALRQIR